MFSPKFYSIYQSLTICKGKIIDLGNGYFSYPENNTKKLKKMCVISKGGWVRG